jgi:hypothetical protein
MPANVKFGEIHAIAISIARSSHATARGSIGPASMPKSDRWREYLH